jgi:hypothetical protein
VDGESCVLALPRGNTTFYSTSIKPFYVLDEQVKVDEPGLGQNDQEVEGDSIIIIDAPLLTIP